MDSIGMMIFSPSFFSIAGLACLLHLVIWFWFRSPSNSAAKIAKRLPKPDVARRIQCHGLPAMATIIGVKETGQWADGWPLVRLHVQITEAAAGSVYPATLTVPTSPEIRARLVPLHRVPVRLDPRHTHRVVLDL